MQTILVICDYNDAADLILKNAVGLAKPTNAQVSAVAFFSSAYRKETGNNDIKLLQERLDSSVKKLGDAVAIDGQVIETDDIVGWIKNETNANSHDKLVLKTGHRTEKLFYTPTDWQLIRQLDCALWISAPKKWRSKPCVLVAIDAQCRTKAQQAMNAKVLDYANQWANDHNSQLHVTHVIPIARALGELDIVDRADVIRKHGDTVSAKIKELLDAQKVQPKSVHLTAGTPWLEISSIAKKIKADLVMVGSVGRTGLKGVVLGNTAEKIIHHLRTDLMVIKP